MRLVFTNSHVVLSPNSRKKFLELARRREFLMQKYVALYHELRRRNLVNNAREKLQANMASVINNMEKIRKNLNVYHGASTQKERNAEFNSRINKGSEALAHIASRRPVLKYYKEALEAEKLLVNLQKKWNAKYGPASPGGRRRVSPSINNAMKAMNLNPRGRSPRARTASPTRRTPQRTRSAPASLARGVLLHTHARNNNAARARSMARAGFALGGAHNAKTWRRSPGGRVYPK